MSEPRVRIAEVDDIAQLKHAGRFPGLYVTLSIPTGYFVEQVMCEGGGGVYLVFRKRFAHERTPEG